VAGRATAPVDCRGLVVLFAQLVLSNTPFGRQLYALGNNPEAAKKAGLRTTRLLAAVYVLSGFCAGLGGILALAQLGSVSPSSANSTSSTPSPRPCWVAPVCLAAAAGCFQGTVLGAVLLKSIFNGLVIVQADPYLYPLATSAIIFVALLVDSLRCRIQSQLERRRVF
jgi:ribose transport system permease protein